MTKTLLVVFCIYILAIASLSDSLKAQDTVSFNVNDLRQTMEGFGGSIAYYENWLIAHPKRLMVYDFLFKDLGISILRIRNSYMVEGVYNQGIVDLSNIVKEAKKRGMNPTGDRVMKAVFLCHWNN